MLIKSQCHSTLTFQVSDRQSEKQTKVIATQSSWMYNNQPNAFLLRDRDEVCMQHGHRMLLRDH